MNHYKLMIPGPVDCDEEVLAEMALPVMPHYGKEWVSTYQRTVDLLKMVFQTQNDLFIMVAPGTAALEAGIASLVATGERALVIVNGFFGARLGTVAESYGIDACLLEFPPGQPADPDTVRRKLRAEKDIKAVIVVHHETSTTVLNPIREIAAIAHEFDIPVVVDAVSSMGGMPVPVDEWQLDICITVANKCLEAPPGLAPIAVSERAWRVIEAKAVKHGWYLDLRVWRDYATRWATWHPYPTTLATNNIMALRKSLERIMKEGLEVHFTRYRKAAQCVRDGLRSLGFEMLVEERYAAPLATAVRAMPGFVVSEYQHFLRDRHGLFIAGGLDSLAGKIFRVGHIGKAATREYLIDYLLATEAFLRLQGHEVTIGQSLKSICLE